MAANRLTIAAQLKAYIASSSIRQKDAAEKCGISAPHFANLLNGREGIGFAAARRICDAFPEINPTFLITGDGELLKRGPRPAAVDRSASQADEISHLREQLAQKTAENARLLGIIEKLTDKCA